MPPRRPGAPGARTAEADTKIEPEETPDPPGSARLAVGTFRAAVLEAPGTLRVRQRPVVPPEPGEVRLRVERVGICGTDLALWSGSYPASLPLVPGHEVLAHVQEVGPGVEGFTPGDRVVPEINATCTAWRRPEPCAACRKGMPEHCLQRTVLGIDGLDGGFAESCRVPAGCLHRVPAGMAADRAVLTEPLAAAFQTFEQVGDPRERTVLVLGPGRLGILVVAVARALGAKVAAAARSPRSLERARRFGAQALFAVPDDAPFRPDRSFRRWAGPLGADVVVEATGDARQADTALHLVRPRGTVAIKSTPGQPAPLDLTRVAVQEIRLVGSRCGPFPRALSFLTETETPLESLIEAHYPLETLDEALHAAQRLTKVVVELGPSEERR